MLTKEIEDFNSRYGLKKDPSFFQKEQIDSFVLEHVRALLSFIPEEGLKLTLKGNLPSKVVQQLALMPSTPWDRSFVDTCKRFVEDEQIIAKRAHALCLVGKLIKKEHNKLMLTKKAHKFLALSSAEQFVQLFMMFFDLNLGYFDRYEEAPIVFQATPLFIQIIRDKQKLPRETDVFGAILLDMHPLILDSIDKQILEKTWTQRDKEDIFFDILEHRVITNFLSPMGLVKVQEKEHILSKNIYEKTELLDALLEPVEAIDESKVLSRRALNDMQKYAITQKLEMNLFRECISIFRKIASYKVIDEEEFIEELANQKMTIGTQKQKYLDFYKGLFESIHMTVLLFTQLDKIGARQDLKPVYKSFMNGLYDIVNKKTPYVLLEEMHFLTFTLFAMMEDSLKIDLKVRNSDYLELIQKRTNEEFVEMLNAYMYSLAQLEKLCKKQKKIKPQMEQMTNQALHAFMMMLFEIQLDEFDN